MTNDTTHLYLDQPHTHTNHCWWNPYEARWVCGAAAPAGRDRPLVDVRDMLVVHTAMLREFRLAPAAVRRVAPGDRRQSASVAGHLILLCDMLHHHHEGEDLLLWPKLLDRTPPSALPVIERAEAQHDGLDAALARVGASRTAWVTDPSDGHRDALAAELTTLHVLLQEHLDLEERALLPLAAAVLTQEEWDAIGEHGVETMPKSVLPLAFGMFAYEGDPAVLTQMLAQAPAVPRKVLPLIAPRLYARRARKVHGTATP